MLAFLNMDGKLDFSIELLKFETKTLANISVFTLTIFLEYRCLGKLWKFPSLRCHSGFRLFVFFEKEKVSLPLSL